MALWLVGLISFIVSVFLGIYLFKKIPLSAMFYILIGKEQENIVDLLASYSIFTTGCFILFSVFIFGVAIHWLLKLKKFRVLYFDSYKTLNDLNTIYIFILGFVPLFIKILSSENSIDFFSKIDNSIFFIFIGMAPPYIYILIIKIFAEIYEKIRFS